MKSRRILVEAKGNITVRKETSASKQRLKNVVVNARDCEKNLKEKEYPEILADLLKNVSVQDLGDGMCSAELEQR